MNYRHVYHAGNFADVFKHTILITIINKLLQKDKPFGILDAFAGDGLYDLLSEKALKTAESNDGIAQLLQASNQSDLHPVIKQYIHIVQSYGALYPGSPMIVQRMMRDIDRLIVCELHPESHSTLKQNTKNIQNIQVHQIDAYNSLKAFCPFPEGRGLVLLDPAFEVVDEFDRIISALALLHKRFKNGMVMIWYPIKDADTVRGFYERCNSIGYKENITVEFQLDDISTMSHSDARGPKMRKCGVLVLNPPDIRAEITEIMQDLAHVYQGSCYRML